MTSRLNQFLATSRGLLILWAANLILALLPVFNEFLRNRYQVSVTDLVVPISLSLLTAVVVAGIFYPLWRRARVPALIGSLFLTALLVFQYGPLLSAISQFFVTHFHTSFFFGHAPLTSLILLALLVALCLWVTRYLEKNFRHKRLNSSRVVRAIVVGLTAALLIELVPVVRDVVIEWPQFFYRPTPVTVLPKASSTLAKPDIYYIELDDYTNPTVLKNQLNFDNSLFTNFLQNQQYYVNNNAYGNYTFSTISVASTLNANYLTDEVKKFGQSSQQTVIPYEQAIKNSGVIQQFKNLGYRYDLIGSWYDMSNASPLADHVYQKNGQLVLFNHTWTLNDFAVDWLVQSVYGDFVQHGLRIGQERLVGYNGQSNADQITDSLRTLGQLAAAPAGGRFIFANILLPHDQYFFNPDGSTSPNATANNVGKPIGQKYVDQVKFANNQIEPILQTINTQSHGQAIVILQSDEGPYPLVLSQQDFDPDDLSFTLNNDNMLNWSAANLQMKYGLMAAYHVPLASSAELNQAADPVNIFRLVLNKYFQANLPYLPRCYYAFPAGRNKAFTFTNINSQLTGETDKSCLASGSG